MANFIGMVYGTLKAKGIDTSKMSTEEAIAKFNEINKEESGGNKPVKADSPNTQKEKLNKEYAKALKTAKEKVDKEEQEAQKRSTRILESVRQKNAGIKKYEQQNEQWKAKVQESYRLAAQGKLKEADKVYEEGRKIYESIPKEYRKN